MPEIRVVNVKCKNCVNKIIKELSKLWVGNIEVCFSENDSPKGRTIKFEGDKNLVKKELTELGYPKVGTKEAESLLKKAKSFIFCVSDKFSK